MASLNGGVYSYQVEAADPEGDPISFSLADAPEGMTIDPESGLLSWAYGQDIPAEVKYVIIVRDDREAESRQPVHQRFQALGQGGGQ